MNKIYAGMALTLALWSAACVFSVPSSGAAGKSAKSSDKGYYAQAEKMIADAQKEADKNHFDKALRMLYQAKKLAHKNKDAELERTITNLQKQIADARKKRAGNAQPNGGTDNGGPKYSKTGSGALVQDDPTKHFQGCSGPKSKTYAYVTDANGKFLGYDKSSIDAAVKRGEITRDEADRMTISPVSKRVGADGKYYYVDNRTGKRVNP